MFRHSLRFLVIGAAATAGSLTIGMGVAQAQPVHVNPCVISPQACQGPPIVHVDPCVINPSLCPPPQPQPQPQPPKQQGNGSQGGTGHGSGSTGGSSTDASSGSSTLAGTPTAVHRVSHQSSGSDNSALVLGASGALAASLAGLAGIAVWRRRAVA
jgi:MYXO-CTERM domain-containing protein